MASSSGSASVAPAPRRNVRRGRAIFVTIISVSPCSPVEGFVDHTRVPDRLSTNHTEMEVWAKSDEIGARNGASDPDSAAERHACRYGAFRRTIGPLTT